MPETFSEASVPDQSGRTIVITGANTGIGYEAARVLDVSYKTLLNKVRDLNIR